MSSSSEGSGCGSLILIAVAVGVWWFEAWPFNPEGPLDFQSKFVPEVAYMVGSDTKWWSGDRFSSKDDCLSAARSAAAGFSGGSPSRVTSVACQLWRGDRFLYRVK